MSGRREAELRESDARARLRAQTDFRRPLVLEAGAGTGKTTALVARVIAWCVGPGWQASEAALAGSTPERVARRVLSRVVAITFTEAAAAELASRVGEALRALADGEIPEGAHASALPPAGLLASRGTALHAGLDHLAAQTIHAWCRRLLVEHPLEAGLHTRLEVDAEGRLQEALAREVLEEQLREGYSHGDPALLALAEEAGPRELEQELRALLRAGVPARAFEADPLAAPPIRALVERLAGAAGAVLELCTPLLSLSSGQTASACAEALARLQERLAQEPVADPGSLAALSDWLAQALPDKLRTRLAAWGRGRFTAAESRALGADAGRLRAPAARLAQLAEHTARIEVARLRHGREVLHRALVEVEARLRARGIASFGALLDGASRLLADPRVARQVRAGVDQLLVDEFQDTDHRQCSLVRALALSGPPAARPGLFVVGDPKQSIYGWRSADLRAYEDFVAEVEACGGLRERLSVNYRSDPVLLDEVERAIEPVMRARPGVQAAFEPLVASPANAARTPYAGGGRAAVEHWLPVAWDGGPEPTSSYTASRLEARALAADLRSLHDRAGVDWGRIGVLFRSRGDWDLYLGQLRQHGIPFSVEGDRSYYRRREIIDAGALLRAVLDPNDLLALVAVLRSPLVGVPDAAWIPLWAHGFPGRVCALEGPDPAALAALDDCIRRARAEVPRDIPGIEALQTWDEGLRSALRSLAQCRASAREDPVDVFVERLRTGWLLEASEAARFQGAWRVANLDRFFRGLVEELEPAGDFHRLLRRLRAAVADEEDAEEARPQELSDDAVQILTIHGAKGLGFDHVYVMQLHKGSAPGRRRRVDCAEGADGFEYVLFGAPTPGWDRIESERAQVEEAERVRTLYVALTRARRRLVISGLPPELSTRPGRAGRPSELLAARRSACRDWLGDPEGWAQARRSDADGVLWALPARAEPSDQAPPGPRAPDAVALPSPEVARAAWRRLREQRRRAEQRMRRPLGSPASRVDDDSGPRPEAPPVAGDRPARRVAAAVGTAVHRALELLDPGAEHEAALARAREVCARSLESELGPGERAAALQRSEGLLRRFLGGSLGARLRDLAPHVVARELPVLLPPGPEDEAVGFVAGALDLVYADPAEERLVIADYKTGERGDHRAQAARYCRALRQALRLDYEPRFELWYLEHDLVEVWREPEPARPESPREPGPAASSVEPG